MLKPASKDLIHRYLLKIPRIKVSSGMYLQMGQIVFTEMLLNPVIRPTKQDLDQKKSNQRVIIDLVSPEKSGRKCSGNVDNNTSPM